MEEGRDFEMKLNFPSTVMCLLDISTNDFVFRTCCVSFSIRDRQMFEWSSVYDRTMKFVCRMAHRHFLEWVFFSEEISLRARSTSLFLGNTP